MATHFKTYGYLVCGYTMLVSFQYGYHISALNQIQAVLTCNAAGTGNIPSSYLLPCIPMSDSIFSIVTAIFTVGGFVGSLIANTIMDGRGRRAAIQASSSCVAAGSLVMAVGSSVELLAVGRFLVGLGSGVSICVTPVYLAEISPARIRGSVGILTQLGVVLGIMITQILGYTFAIPDKWRYVLFFSFFLAALQLVTSSFLVESPTWLKRVKHDEAAETAIQRLWLPVPHRLESGAEDPLLARETDPAEQRAEPSKGLWQLLGSPELRKPLMIVCFSMLAQQISGINAVLYYSNAILAKSLPDLGPFISLAITVLNVLMTLPPIFLIDRWGRRKLLMVSIVGALVSLLAVGYGLNGGYATLASIAILVFVMSFAIGLGPVPFVLIPDVSPAHAVSLLSSVALSVNWLTNCVVGMVFLPIRNLLSSGDPAREGRVFYAFAVLFFIFSYIFIKSM